MDTIASGRDFVKTVTVALPIVSERVFVAVCAVGVVESVTWNVIERLVTIAVVVPLITPEAGSIDNPLGSGLLPGATDQLYGLTPPIAASAAE